MKRTLASFWLLIVVSGCEKPEVVTIGGRETDLTLVLTNPTACADCDPFRDVDTLRIDVTAGDEAVASDSFAYPDEAATLPDLEGFGVVRIALVGLSAGHVVSAGRTAEIALVPGEAMSVSLVFLPINRAYPLPGATVQPRMRHASVRLRDGRVLLLGGTDPLAERAWPTVEVYDPGIGEFTASESLLPAPIADPRWVWTKEGELLLAGGFGLFGEDTVASLADSAVYDPDAGTITAAGPLSTPRSGHCLTLYRDRQGVAMGGAEGDEVDYLKPSEETGEWAFSALPMRDFDAHDVTGCVSLADERVYVQGATSASTGLWEPHEGDDLGAAFRKASEGGDARYVSGAMLVPLADGRVWIGGGIESSSGQPVADARAFEAAELRFSVTMGLERPRFDGAWVPWIREDWGVAGCGWADATRTRSESSVELLNPAGAAPGEVIALDRDRPGCALSVLLDGSVLVTGGYAAGAAGVADAALLVPWPDE